MNPRQLTLVLNSHSADTFLVKQDKPLYSADFPYNER